MKKLLQEIGLTESESKVYLALLDLETSTIGPIASKSGVAYSKVYLLLEKLIEKGLASYIIKKKTKYFSPTNPKKILSYLDGKKEEINKQEKEVKEILPKLIKKLSLLKEQEKAEIYEGFEGYMSAYQEAFDLLKKNDEILTFGASAGEFTDIKRSERFFNKINLLRHEKKIKFRIIFNENVRKYKLIKFWKKQKNTKVKFLSTNAPVAVNTHANRTMIVYWSKDKPKLFLITSQIVADSFRKYFEELWKIAKR